MDDLARRFREAADAGADMRVILWPLTAVFLAIATGATLIVIKATYHLLFVADWNALP